MLHQSWWQRPGWSRRSRRGCPALSEVHVSSVPPEAILSPVRGESRSPGASAPGLGCLQCSQPFKGDSLSPPAGARICSAILPRADAPGYSLAHFQGCVAGPPHTLNTNLRVGDGYGTAAHCQKSNSVPHAHRAWGTHGWPRGLKPAARIGIRLGNYETVHQRCLQFGVRRVLSHISRSWSALGI